jgi:hypothetical protein
MSPLKYSYELLMTQFNMFHVVGINEMHTFFLKGQTYALGFMNLILLYSIHQYVAAKHEAIFRVVRTRIQIQYVEINLQLKIIEFCVKIQN